MIKILFTNINNNFQLNYGINLFLIENKDFFRKIYFSFEEEVFFSNDAKELKTSDKIIINNPLDIDLNDKKNLTILYKNLSKDLRNKYGDELAIINKQIFDLFDKISDKSTFLLDYEPEINIEKFFLSCGICFKKQETYLEQLLLFIKTLNEMNNFKVIIFFNLLNFLTIEEIKILSSELEKNQVILVDFTTYLTLKDNIINVFKVDEDLCII